MSLGAEQPPIHVIESSITSITWVPADATPALRSAPLEVGTTGADEPPPETLGDLDDLRRTHHFREANQLRAWIAVEDGRVVDHGHAGRGVVGGTRPEVGAEQVRFADVELPVIRPEPEVGRDAVRFVQTAGGRIGVPAPRPIADKPHVRLGSVSAWTTLELVIQADGRSSGALVAASPFPRHSVYDADGRLVRTTDAVDPTDWSSGLDHGTPWGSEESAALAEAVASQLEREVAGGVLRVGATLEHRRLGPGETLVRQGEPGVDLFLLLIGALAVEVDGVTVAEIGAGAVVGERALLEGGTRTATLRASTPCRVAVVAPGQVDRAKLIELARGHRREDI